MERTVSIGFGSQDAIKEAIADLAAQAERGEDPAMYVKGNGQSTPDLTLRFSNENDSDWPEPLVDYGEG